MRTVRPSWRHAPSPLALGALGATAALGWLAKFRCLTDGLWLGGEQFRWACYTDVGPLYFGRGLSDGLVPYLEAPIEYPVLTGLQMGLAAAVANLSGFAEPVLAFLGVVGVLNALAALAVLWVLHAEGVPEDRQLRWALAPPVLLTLFANWDVVAVLALVVAVAAHRRQRHVVAGVAAGVGAAAKLFPALVVPVVVVDLVLRRRWRDAAVHVGAAAGVWVVLNAPVAIVAFDGWARFYELSRERMPHWNSVYAISYRLGLPRLGEEVNVVATALFLVGAAGILVAGARRVDPGQRWMLILPLLCWFLATNKVYSPQFSLWIAALVALIAVPAAPVVAFFVVDTATYIVEYLFFGGRAGFDPVFGYGWLGGLVALRLVVMGWIGAATFRLAAQGQGRTARWRSMESTSSGTPDSTG